jgi:ArsR family transcriptional regulator
MNDVWESERCARLLKAIADPDRLRIIQCLMEEPKNVSELAAQMQADIVRISHHLGVLRHANLVLDERHGRFIVYQLHPDVFHAHGRPRSNEQLDLGCCKLELPKPSH